MSETAPFFVDRAKGGRASCKGCKGNCPSGELRLAKVVPSPYGENQSMKSWHHVQCLMNALLKQRPATKRIDSVDDIGNWSSISKEDQEYIIKEINTMEKLYAEKNSGKYTAKVLTNESSLTQAKTSPKDTSNTETSDKKHVKMNTEDNQFELFCQLCKKISKVDAYTEKTNTVNNFFQRGTGGSFEGDLALWCKLLLPQVSKRVYNLKSKQLVKLFSRIFNSDHDDMLTHLENGDVADTVQHFFTKSKTVQPAKESTIAIHDVENFLEDLSKLTREEEQIYQFKKIVKRCTLDDLKMLIRLIKGDLRINAGPKHILEGVHPDAYNVFQSSRDLDMVLDKVLSNSTGVKHRDSLQKNVKAEIQVMTPVLPMLAEACKSVEMAMKKCPNGMFSEIKYDGERVQLHKKGNEIKYFSRALKPVMAHKVNHFKDYLPKAFPKGSDLILDAEVLMVDVNTGKPLPFGTLGIHKQSEFKDAQVCLFVFDCLYYNGESLINIPIRKRRQILHENMVEVTNHIMFSEQKLIQKPSDLAKMIAEVLQLGLEGLVLKDLESTYEPGKRHWLKVKKDYLFDGAMADTADLVVLGAWFGTGKKGGMMSVFLMGCHDTRRNKWLTVTKVHTGHDDSTLERLQKELSPFMVKISRDYNKVPSWMDCNKGMVPDFVAKDPKEQPVWEITGTELTKANLHTADGISVRFPRVTRIRSDKDWKTATNLDELKHLFKTSKEKTDVSLLNKLAATASKSESDISPTKSPKVRKENEKRGVKRELSAERDIKTAKSPKIKKEKDLDTTSERDIESRSFKIKKEKDKPGRERELSAERNKSLKLKTPTDTSKDSKIDSFFVKKEDPVKAEQAIKRTKDSPSTSNKLKHSDVSDDPPKKKIKMSPSTTKTPDKHERRKSKKIMESSDSEQESQDDSSQEKSSDSYEPTQLYPENPLPDVFKHQRLGFYPDFISFKENVRQHFERHWIAYGGVVDKSVRSMDVDFVVHANKSIQFKQMQKLRSKLPENVRHVTKDWLIKCINEVKLCDTTKYAVRVVP